MHSTGHGGGGGWGHSATGHGARWGGGGGGYWHGYRSTRGGCCGGLCCLLLIAVVLTIALPVYFFASHACISETASQVATQTLCLPGSMGSVTVSSDPAVTTSYLLSNDPKVISPSAATQALVDSTTVGLSEYQWHDTFWWLPSSSEITYVVNSTYSADLYIMDGDNLQKWKENKGYKYETFKTGKSLRGTWTVPYSDDWHVLTKNEHSYARITVTSNFTVRQSTFDLAGQLKSCNSAKCSFSVKKGEAVVSVVSPSSPHPKLQVTKSFPSSTKLGVLAATLAAVVVLSCLCLTCMFLIFRATRNSYSSF